MTEKKPSADETQGTATTADDPARREALIKIGKYAAYTAPAMMVTVSTAHAGNITPGPPGPPTPGPPGPPPMTPAPPPAPTSTIPN